MAISVSVPEEITKYRSKLFFGLSGRQAAYLLLSALVGTGLGALCQLCLHLSLEVTGYLIIAAVLPLVALGFIRPHNMSFEAYAALWLRHLLGRNLLPYQTELLLDTSGVQEQNQPKERRQSHGTFQKKSRNHVQECQIYPGGTEGRPEGRRHRKAKIQDAKRKIKGAGAEIRLARRKSAKQDPA